MMCVIHQALLPSSVCVPCHAQIIHFLLLELGWLVLLSALQMYGCEQGQCIKGKIAYLMVIAWGNRKPSVAHVQCVGNVVGEEGWAYPSVIAEVQHVTKMNKQWT